MQRPHRPRPDPTHAVPKRVGAHNSVVGADQGFRAPSWDQESARDSVHEDSTSARIAARQRPRPSFRHPQVCGYGTCGCWRVGVLLGAASGAGAGRSRPLAGGGSVSVSLRRGRVPVRESIPLVALRRQLKRVIPSAGQVSAKTVHLVLQTPGHRSAVWRVQSLDS